MSVLATDLGLGTRREAIVPRIDADAPLLEALRRRDPSAAEQLVGSYGDRAYRLALRITRNAADAEEAVQDAFCNVIRKVDTFRGDSAFRSWLYRVVSNAAYQKVRGTGRLGPVLRSRDGRAGRGRPFSRSPRRVDHLHHVHADDSERRAGGLDAPGGTGARAAHPAPPVASVVNALVRYRP